MLFLPQESIIARLWAKRPGMSSLRPKVPNLLLLLVDAMGVGSTRAALPVPPNICVRTQVYHSEDHPQ